MSIENYITVLEDSSMAIKLVLINSLNVYKLAQILDHKNLFGVDKEKDLLLPENSIYKECHDIIVYKITKNIPKYTIDKLCDDYFNGKYDWFVFEIFLQSKKIDFNAGEFYMVDKKPDIMNIIDYLHKARKIRMINSLIDFSLSHIEFKNLPQPVQVLSILNGCSFAKHIWNGNYKYDISAKNIYYVYNKLFKKIDWQSLYDFYNKYYGKTFFINFTNLIDFWAKHIDLDYIVFKGLFLYYSEKTKYSYKFNGRYSDKELYAFYWEYVDKNMDFDTYKNILRNNFNLGK